MVMNGLEQCDGNTDLLLHVMLFSELLYDQLWYSSTQVGKTKLELCNEALGAGLEAPLLMERPKHCLWPSSWRCQVSRSHRIALPASKILSFPPFMGGQEQVCADLCTRVIDPSNNSIIPVLCWCFSKLQEHTAVFLPLLSHTVWLVAPSGNDA